MNRRSAIATGTLAVALLASVLVPGAHAGAPITEAANRSAATGDAEERLAALQLPPGASRSESRPDGIESELKGPPIEVESPNRVDLGGWWVVPGAPADVLAWFRANLPPGSHLGVQGFGNNLKTGTEYQFIELAWPPIPERLDNRAVLIGVSAREGGDTALRVDSQAVWISPHPASERIPAAARWLEAQWYRPGKRQRSVTYTNPRFVKEIASLIEGLPIAQPGVVHCPFEPADPPTVTLRFRSGRGGRPLAEAVQALPAGGACNGMTLTIRGKGQPSLEDAAGVVSRLRQWH